MDPKVSIIIPTFNRSHYLPQTIESALAQDYYNLEVIVSDNASTDNTPEIVKKYSSDRRFAYFRNSRNIGLVANYRKAVGDYARGDFCVILSDDDYFTDDHYLFRVVERITNNPGMVMVYGNGHILYEDTGTLSEFRLPFDEVEDGKKIFMSRGAVKPLDFLFCNVVFSRMLAIKLNAFLNEDNYSSDSELFLKMCLFGSVGVIKDPVSVYRIHEQNITDRIRSNVQVYINNLEYLIEPHRRAKLMKTISGRDLRAWERRLIYPGLRDTLMTTIIEQPEQFPNALEILEKKNWESYHKLKRNILFQLELFLARRSHVLCSCLFPSFRRKVARARKKAS